MNKPDSMKTPWDLLVEGLIGEPLPVNKAHELALRYRRWVLEGTADWVLSSGTHDGFPAEVLSWLANDLLNADENTHIGLNTI